MANYDIPVTYTDKRGLERVGYKPFFADEFANNPNSSFRLAGGNNPYFNVQEALLNQFEKTGQIIGGETDDAFTYFSRGQTSAGDYLPINLDKNNQVGRNVLYEVNSRFNPHKSNLYSVVQGFTDNEITNNNQILKPNKDASWLQRVNPFERRGIKITTFDTAETFNDASTRGIPSLRYSKPLGESVYYDRTKPWYKTPVAQNLKNLGVEAKIVLAQPETKAVLAAAGDATVKAGGAASFLIDAPEFYYDASKKRDADARTAAKANWWDEGDAVLSYVNKPKSLAEKLSLAAESSLKSAANAITFGAAYGGTGKNRPKRGLGEMERSTDDMYRILKERGDKIVKQKAAE